MDNKRNNVLGSQKAIPSKYALAKIGLALLFVFIMVAFGVTAWLLLTESFSIVKLVILLLLMGASYIGGACHGYINRKIEKIDEEQTTK